MADMAASSPQGETVGCFVHGWRFTEQVLLPNVSQPISDVVGPAACQKHCKDFKGCQMFGYFAETQTCYLGAGLDVGGAWRRGMVVESSGCTAGPAECSAVPRWCSELPTSAFPGNQPVQSHMAWALGAAPPNLQCWPKSWKRREDVGCLTWQLEGCGAIKDMMECGRSRDGSAIVDEAGLRIHGEPCVWCGGGLCHSGSATMCEPLDYLLRGEGRAFNDFTAKYSYSVANCKVKVQPPQLPEELSCLTAQPGGCEALDNVESCLASKDGRIDASFKSNLLYGQPCVWCAGGICHTEEASPQAPALAAPVVANSTESTAVPSGGPLVCETFDMMFNGEGHEFSMVLTRNGLEVAGCKDGTKHSTTMSVPQAEYKFEPYGDVYVEELEPCPGEQPTVLEDMATGWPGTCLGLERRLLPHGVTCAQDCALNVTCPSWQERAVEGGAAECWQGLGHDCYGFPGGRVLLRAQRLQHGAYRVLKDLQGTQVSGLAAVFPVSLYRSNKTMGIKNCQNMCLSAIRCQVWTYSTNMGCLMDMGNLPYPMTAAMVSKSVREAAFIVAGEYIQRMCKDLADQVSKILQVEAASMASTPPPMKVRTMVLAPTRAPAPAVAPAPFDPTPLLRVVPTLFPMPVGILPVTWTTTSTTVMNTSLLPVGAVETQQGHAASSGTNAKMLAFAAIGTIVAAILVTLCCVIGYRALTRGNTTERKKRSTDGFAALPAEEDPRKVVPGQVGFPGFTGILSPSQGLASPTGANPLLPTLPMLPQSQQQTTIMMPQTLRPMELSPARQAVPPMMPQNHMQMQLMPQTQVQLPVNQMQASDAGARSRQQPFSVAIDRQSGAPLGVEVDYALGGNAVIVSSVNPYGLVASWNAANPQCRLLPGDRIVAVNGESYNTEAMMQQLRIHQVLNLAVIPGVMQ